MLVKPALLLASGALVAGALVAPGAGAASLSVETPVSAQPVRDANAEITFYAGLPRDSAALEAEAVARSTPGELTYRDHPSLTAAGEEFGATKKAIRALRKVAEPLGITVSVDAGRILARLTATVETWERLYGMDVIITPATNAQPFTEYAIASRKAPKALRTVVTEMLPRYAEYVRRVDTQGILPEQLAELRANLADPGSPQPWPINRGTLPADTCDASALADKAVYAPAQIHTAYGTAALGRKGIQGRGARLTIVSLGGGYAPSDIALAAECFGYTQPGIDIQLGTGLSEPLANATFETHLDLITSSSVLDEAESITLLQVADSATAFTDAFARMLEGDVVPDAVSVSYGICEPYFREEFRPLVTLNEDLLRMAAIVGTTVVIATGDSGTSMCGAELAAETGEPTLWYPATSPWVTAVGGTRLTLKADNTRRGERVWNDTPYVGGAVPAPAGAGGPSLVFARPWWQSGSTPTGPRTIPDVAVMGAIKPGWPIVYGGGVYPLGGTSGGAPFVAANLAAMTAKQRDRGYPSIGFANAWLYQAATDSRSPYFDVRNGNNGVQLVGCCVATRGYDMASGLGAPAMDVLYRTLPRPAG